MPSSSFPPPDKDKDEDLEEKFADIIRITRSDRSLFRKILILIRNPRNEEKEEVEEALFLHPSNDDRDDEDDS